MGNEERRIRIGGKYLSGAKYGNKGSTGKSVPSTIFSDLFIYEIRLFQNFFPSTV